MFQRATPRRADHRPWPVPSGPWVMTQSWHDLLFAHWQVPVHELRKRIPRSLEIDTFAGRAYVAVVPFTMSNVRVRMTPPLPGVSSCLELNVRTYVTDGKKPGVWFFSLDASSPLVAAGARAGFSLPYYWACMSAEQKTGAIRYASTRIASAGAVFRATYAPTGPVFEPEPDTLEQFLTERYCLYTTFAGKLLRCEIHHDPWPLQQATAEIAENTMTRILGIELPGEPPLLHFARRQDVLVWPITPAW